MENERKFEIKLFFNEEQVKIYLNSDYKYFINSICNIFKISLGQFKSLSLSYLDSDKDNIILSGIEDYNIFFQQVSENQVDNFRVTINENSNLDQNECLIHFLDYKENVENENNNKNRIRMNIDNNFNYDEEKELNENRNNLYGFNDNDNNFNYDINNHNSQNQQDYFNINEIKNEEIKNKKINEVVPIDDLIFDCECNYCHNAPIICKMLYCDECNFHLCQECESKGVKHEHNLFSIESKEEFMKIKEKEKSFNDNNPNLMQRDNDSNLVYKNEGNRRKYYITFVFKIK